MYGRHTLGFLLLLATCVLPGRGQNRINSTAIFSIDGSVRDGGDQHALENIRVDLKQSAGIPVGTTFTRTNGEFEFSGLSNGEYVIEVKAKDYEPLKQTVEILNSARRGMFLFLTKPALAVKPTFSASISAHQLSAPYKAHTEFDKGVVLLFDKSDYRGAITQFQRAIKDFPTYYEAYAQEGIAYLSLGEAPAAEEALRKSADLSSGKYTEALILLSGLLNNTNRYQEAVTFSRKALQTDAGSWQGSFELARALFGLKQMDEAEQSAIHARDRNPDNPAIQILLANIHMNQRNYSSAVKDIDAFLKIAPAGPDAEQARKRRDQLQAFLKQDEDDSGVDADEICDASPLALSPSLLWANCPSRKGRVARPGCSDRHNLAGRHRR